MDELAELSKAMDALGGKTDDEIVSDLEYVGKVIREITKILEKLINIQASLYLRQASRSEWDLKRLEKEYILSVLAECSDNHSQAARRLGIARNSLWRKLKEYAADEG